MKTHNTTITVEKIDTTENTKTSKNKSSIKSESKKSTHTTENIINNIETLDELSLVLCDVSENEKYSLIDTDTLLNKKAKKNNKSIKYTLNFPKTQSVNINIYNKINKYVKKNYKTVVDTLYEKNLLKNKNSPYRLVFHIYVNYLNEDLNIKFL
tara:strand:- start:2196 stop:2657 length:462 start_codon:yes stop_codon:yes gene_type:complete